MAPNDQQYKRVVPALSGQMCGRRRFTLIMEHHLDALQSIDSSVTSPSPADFLNRPGISRTTWLARARPGLRRLGLSHFYSKTFLSGLAFNYRPRSTRQPPYGFLAALASCGCGRGSPGPPTVPRVCAHVCAGTSGPSLGG